MNASSRPPTPSPRPLLNSPLHEPHLTNRRSTSRDTVICLLLTLGITPIFLYALFFSAIEGPEQFFGDYSSAAGHVALILSGLTFLAACAWVWFFSGYRRAAGWACVIGCLVTGAAAATALLLAVAQVDALRHGPGPGRPDQPADAEWGVLVIMALFAFAALCAGAAVRHVRARLVGVVPAAGLCLAGLCVAARYVADSHEAARRFGGPTSTHDWMLMLLVATPAAVGALLVMALTPVRRPRRTSRSPGDAS